MTEKQKQVLDEVHEKLTEHFDGFVYVVNIADDDDQGNYVTAGGYGGGIALALGLCGCQKIRLEKKFTEDEIS